MDKPKRLFTLLAFLLFLCFASAVYADTIVIGSFDSSRSERPFTGSNYSNMVGQLLNPANFGPGGIVDTPVSVAPGIGAVDAVVLSAYDVFVVTEVGSLSAAEVNALRDFVLGGHSLVLVTNSLSSGRVGANDVLQALDGGSVTDPTGGSQSATAGTIVGSGLSTNGPFGTLSPGSNFGATISSTLNLGSSSTLIGTNSVNVILEIAPGALGLGSGGVLATSDVLFMNFFIPPATVAGNENNAILLKNFIAAAPAPVPEPASLLLLGSGLAGVALRRRKK